MTVQGNWWHPPAEAAEKALPAAVATRAAEASPVASLVYRLHNI